MFLSNILTSSAQTRSRCVHSFSVLPDDTF